MKGSFKELLKAFNWMLENNAWKLEETETLPVLDRSLIPEIDSILDAIKFPILVTCGGNSGKGNIKDETKM